MNINIRNIGLALSSEIITDETEPVYKHKIGYYFLYRSNNGNNSIEGEAIRYEIHELNTGLPPNQMIYAR